MGRTWSGYQYDIPDQYQGRFERLRVLGDKRARSSALQIAERPAPVGPAARTGAGPDPGHPRDPEPVRQHRHRGPTAQDVTDRRHPLVQQICEAVSVVRPLLDPSELLDMRYETFVGEPPRRWPTSAGSSTWRPDAVLPRGLRRHRLAEHQPEPRRRRLDDRGAAGVERLIEELRAARDLHLRRLGPDRPPRSATRRVRLRAHRPVHRRGSAARPPSAGRRRAPRRRSSQS